MRVLGLVSIVLLPACTVYWGTNDKPDARVENRPDAPESRPDARADATVVCTVVLSYDWNDGTPQGWAASTSVTNTGGALVFTNQGNGSLQAFGPNAPSSLAETDSISFKVQIDQYSGITAPSQLVRSFFSLNTPFPGDGTLQFTLDMSSLAFHEPRVFTFPISAGTFTGSLGRAAFLDHVKSASLLFAEQSFNGNSSAGTLDDFSIVHCVP